MKVRVQPADHGGCGYYRLRWPAAALQAQGCDIDVRDNWTDAWRPVAVGNLVQVHIEADVVVLQRPMHHSLLEMTKALQRDGIAVVVELDDDFHSLPKGHPARRGTAAMHDEKSNRMHLRKICEIADMVTCTTPAIAARYAPHGRFMVVPNFVPMSYLDVQRTRDAALPLRVGWTGSTDTHIGDLLVCGDGVAGALAETGAVFHAVGTGKAVAEQLGLDDLTATGWQEIDRYPFEYACLDVAIVPLQPCPFNEAKSNLKGLEAAALGVPFVASPTSPYQQLHAHGVGRLASTPHQWREMLVELLTDAVWRQEAAERGRAWATGQTIEGNCWRFLEAWENALIHRRGRKAA